MNANLGPLILVGNTSFFGGQENLSEILYILVPLLCNNRSPFPCRKATTTGTNMVFGCTPHHWNHKINLYTCFISPDVFLKICKTQIKCTFLIYIVNCVCKITFDKLFIKLSNSINIPSKIYIPLKLHTFLTYF